MNSAVYYDQYLLRLINSRWQNEFFDAVMPWLRNSSSWMPLYLFMGVLVLVNFRKNAFWWMLFFAGTAILTDFISSKIIKENIYRLRPCNDADISSWLRVLAPYRPQSSSFTSSHAANHFGSAMFMYMTLKGRFGRLPWLFFFWAFAICYAQLYVGVHYPLDVIAGGVIGILIGYLSGQSYNKNYGLVP